MGIAGDVKRDYVELGDLNAAAAEALHRFRRCGEQPIGSNGSFLVEILERLDRLKALERSVRTGHLLYISLHRKVSPAQVAKAQTACQNLKDDVETWYYFAHRIKVAVNDKASFPGTAKLKPKGLSIARNKFIEHRDSGADLGNFGVSLRDGLFLGLGLGQGNAGDEGFISNAKEFYRDLERIFPSCDTARWPLPGTKAQAPADVSFTQEGDLKESKASMTVANPRLENDGFIVRFGAKGPGGVVFTSPAILTVLPSEGE